MGTSCLGGIKSTLGEQTSCLTHRRPQVQILYCPPLSKSTIWLAFLPDFSAIQKVTTEEFMLGGAESTLGQQTSYFKYRRSSRGPSRSRQILHTSDKSCFPNLNALTHLSRRLGTREPTTQHAAVKTLETEQHFHRTGSRWGTQTLSP